MATLDSIQWKIAKLQSQAEAIKKRQSAKVIAEIHSLMSEHRLTVDDLGSAPAGKKYGGKHATTTSVSKSAGGAKYRDPKTGATWSGHGRAPGWIASAKNRDKFLVDGSAVSAPVAGDTTAKPGNYRRGPQPALYRDPKSGATWSGRGKAPAWLAGAKDRTKFLIDGAAPKAADGKERAPGTAAAKKAAATMASDAAPAKRGPARRAATKRVGAKNATAKKVASNKIASKKVAFKKAASNPTTVKKAAGKKSAATGQKATASKAPAKRAAGEKAPASAEVLTLTIGQSGTESSSTATA